MQWKPRALILDLFGDYLRYAGSEVRLADITELLAVFDIEAATVRVNLSRLRKEGWFTTRRVGRETVYSLTPHMLEILNEGRERIFRRRDEKLGGALDHGHLPGPGIRTRRPGTAPQAARVAWFRPAVAIDLAEPARPHRPRSAKSPPNIRWQKLMLSGAGPATSRRTGTLPRDAGISSSSARTTGNSSAPMPPLMTRRSTPARTGERHSSNGCTLSATSVASPSGTPTCPASCSPRAGPAVRPTACSVQSTASSGLQPRNSSPASLVSPSGRARRSWRKRRVRPECPPWPPREPICNK